MFLNKKVQRGIGFFAAFFCLKCFFWQAAEGKGAGIEASEKKWLAEIRADPKATLSTEQSLQLITYLFKKRKEEIEKVKGKEILLIVGNEASGKSTFINYLEGCAIEKSEKKHGEVIMKVDEESAIPSFCEIDHTGKSKTVHFNFCNTTHYLIIECRNFSENARGEEDIANAMLLTLALQKAKMVKVVVLFDFEAIGSARGYLNVRTMQLCETLLGVAPGKHGGFARKLLLALTRVPDSSKKSLGHSVEFNDFLLDKVMITGRIDPKLQPRTFYFDPLYCSSRTDVDLDSRLSSSEWLEAIQKMEPFTQEDTVFTLSISAQHLLKIESWKEMIIRNVVIQVRQSKLKRLVNLYYSFVHAFPIKNKVIENYIDELNKEINGALRDKAIELNTLLSKKKIATSEVSTIMKIIPFFHDSLKYFGDLVEALDELDINRLLQEWKDKCRLTKSPEDKAIFKVIFKGLQKLKNRIDVKLSEKSKSIRSDASGTSAVASEYRGRFGKEEKVIKIDYEGQIDDSKMEERDSRASWDQSKKRTRKFAKSIYGKSTKTSVFDFTEKLPVCDQMDCRFKLSTIKVVDTFDYLSSEIKNLENKATLYKQLIKLLNEREEILREQSGFVDTDELLKLKGELSDMGEEIKSQLEEKQQRAFEKTKKIEAIFTS